LSSRATAMGKVRPWSLSELGCCRRALCRAKPEHLDEEWSSVDGGFAFVGPNAGAYEQVDTWRYVGDGLGTYEKEEKTVVHPSLGRRICIGALIASALLLILATVFYFWWSSQKPVTLQQRRSLECQAGLVYGHSDWSDEKKDFCCRKYGFGCPPASTGSTGVKDNPAAGIAADCKDNNTAWGCHRFDCRAGTSNWQHGWSFAKRRFCCSQKHVNCTGAAIAGAGCDAGCVLSGKQASCRVHIEQTAVQEFRTRIDATGACRAAHISVLKQCPQCRTGCANLTQASCLAEAMDGSPYDCVAGYHMRKRSWSYVKKDWCCEHRHLGCPPTSGNM